MNKKQLEALIEGKCDRCDEFKPRTFSYFTERMWLCDDCKINQKKDKVVISGVILRNHEEGCKDVSEQLLFYLERTN
jgi:hypothetical protein